MQRDKRNTPARTPGAEEAPRRGEGEAERRSERQEPDDPREEEGWSQPESSAQKHGTTEPGTP